MIVSNGLIVATLLARGEEVMVFFVLIVIVVVAVIAFQSHAASLVNNAYERVSSQYVGTFYPGKLFDRPSFRFAYNGTSVYIDVHATGGKNNASHYTQCHIGYPDRRLRCELYPEGLMERLGKLVGMEDLIIGSPQFDDAYIITGNDPRAIREFLSPHVQAAIMSLRSFMGNNDIYVSVSSGQLLVKKLGYIKDYTTLRRFVRMSLELYDYALLTNSEGIEFPDEETASVSLHEATCQICGEDVTTDVVFCRSCRTPHHRDCWDYYGSCSTYGCGEKRYAGQGRVARPRRA